MAEHNESGKNAEEQAAEWLKGKGYEHLTWTC
jgi:Holliday junction resolvase-like predicted endonuclease